MEWWRQRNVMSYTGGQEIHNTYKEKTQRKTTRTDLPSRKPPVPEMSIAYEIMKIVINMYKKPYSKRKLFREVIYFDLDLLWKHQVITYLKSSPSRCSDKKTTLLFANSLGRKRYIALRLFDRTTEDLWQGKRGSPRSHLQLQPQEQDSPPF